MDRNKNSDRMIKGAKEIWERYKYAALIALLGVALLLWPNGNPETEEVLSSENPVAITPAEEAEALQREMEEVLSKISGVGEVRLLLTVESDGERQLAQDSVISYRGSSDAPEDYTRSSETVKADSGEGIVVTKRRYATYRGALVVCQGGDRPEVQLAVTQAVTALTGLSADRVTVAKWQ